MTSISSKLLRISNSMKSAATNVFHYWRTNKKPPYLIWAEDGEDTSFHSSNHKQEQQLHGTCDYFTKEEFDTTVDDIQDALNNISCGWRLNSVQYEEETGLIHYEWEWWVI